MSLDDSLLSDFLGDLDFLDGDTSETDLAARVDTARPELSRWGAAALLARAPQLQRYRGSKGRRAWEQDLDFLLRQLHTDLTSARAPESGTSAWLRSTLASRGVDDDAACAAIHVLQEGLLRCLGQQQGGHAATRLADLTGIEAPPKLAIWLPRT